ncbi:MAG: lytic transglycosylase domain-containing protein [Clostridia bacterium]|nr:lytic transglycosylase domain-containing protein [Clostridia bacterium]
MAKTTRSLIILTVIALITVSYFVAISYFPLSYRAEIKEASQRYGLEEELIRAVILVESSYREDAVSHAGAEGLMQMMPETRKWISSKVGVASDGSARSEILLGCGYLRYLLDLTGDETDALMSYNAGYSNVLKWKEGETPFPETVEYVRRVNFARKIYHLI